MWNILLKLYEHVSENGPLMTSDQVDIWTENSLAEHLNWHLARWKSGLTSDQLNIWIDIEPAESLDWHLAS